MRYDEIIKVFKTCDAMVNGKEADWKTVRGQHVAFGANGELVAGNPKVFGKKYSQINRSGNKSQAQETQSAKAPANKANNTKNKSGQTEIKGSEKQVSWAKNIRENINKTLNQAIETMKKDPRYESTPQAKEMVKTLEDRKNKINNSSSAGDIIDFFGRYKPTGKFPDDYMSLMAHYKVTPNNGYNFK